MLLLVGEIAYRENHADMWVEVISLSHIGYVANQVQSEATLSGLKLVSGIAGAGLMASCVVIYFYRLDITLHGQLVRDIATRQRNAAS